MGNGWLQAFEAEAFRPEGRANQRLQQDEQAVGLNTIGRVLQLFR